MSNLMELIDKLPQSEWAGIREHYLEGQQRVAQGLCPVWKTRIEGRCLLCQGKEEEFGPCKMTQEGA